MQGFATLDWSSFAPWTDFLLHTLHYISLAFMIVAYTIKIKQLLAKPAVAEGTPAKGDHAKAIRYSYFLLAMPWEIESQRKHWFRYLEFAMFHIAMAVGIGVAFTMPWGHEYLATPPVIFVLLAVFSLGTLIGLSRLLRRLSDPAVRAISTPDDFFCIILLTLWMASGVLMAPQSSWHGELWVQAYFVLATFFLFYVPFSKISHYVYWPFMRFYIGKHFGHRGVFPKKRVANS
jgi:nitrate reductase gamma subunit